jgi:hypothetical protein
MLFEGLRPLARNLGLLETAEDGFEGHAEKMENLHEAAELDLDADEIADVCAFLGRSRHLAMVLILSRRSVTAGS